MGVKHRFFEYVAAPQRFSRWRLPNEPLKVTYERLLRNADNFMPPGTSEDEKQAAMAMLGNEGHWMMAGAPYYKLDAPSMHMLTRTPLRVPAEAINMPHPQFLVRLEERYFGIETILLGSSHESIFPRWISIQFDGEQGGGVMLRLDANSVIEDEVEKDNKFVSGEVLRAAKRLGLAMVLYASSAHRYIRHDVIEALRERYAAATTEEEKQALVEKSKKRGKFGYIIVADRRELGLTTVHRDGSTDGIGSSLEYQHVRGGHFHAVRYGPGKKLVKVMFYAPCVVRPDLPIRPLEVA